MFPCFLGGRVWRLLASTRSALVTAERSATDVVLELTAGAEKALAAAARLIG